MKIFHRPQRQVTRVFIHCSASDNPNHDNIATIRKWHVEDRGWSDVGYHYFIRKNGDVEYGRDLEKTPAAQQGHNARTIAICLHGLALENFTQYQFKTLKSLCQEINEAYNGSVTFHGHNEVNPNKACPVFDVKKVVGLDSKGKLLN